MRSEFQLSYFRDDHNRLVRVTVWNNKSVELHLLDKVNGENAWIPYNKTRKPSYKSDEQPGIEAPFGIDDLKTQNASCPSFKTH